MLDLPRQETEIVFYNDSDDYNLHVKLINWLRHYSNEFNGARLYTSKQPLIGDNSPVSIRRQRIVDMKKKSIDLISNSKFVFGLEDDSLVPQDAFRKLLRHMEENSGVGVVSGVQMGRWATQMVGVWKINPVEDPIHVTTMPFQKGLIEVDGVGWYCYLTPTKLYKNANYRFEAECLGPDVCYSWDLRKQGLKVLVDWSVICPHVTQYGVFIPRIDNTQVIEWNKSKRDNSWIVAHHHTIEL